MFEVRSVVVAAAAELGQQFWNTERLIEGRDCWHSLTRRVGGQEGAMRDRELGGAEIGKLARETSS